MQKQQSNILNNIWWIPLVLYILIICFFLFRIFPQIRGDNDPLIQKSIPTSPGITTEAIDENLDISLPTNNYESNTTSTENEVLPTQTPLHPTDIPIPTSQLQILPPEFKTLQEYALTLINESRAQNGLNPVEWDELAAGVGQVHAEEMAVNNYMSHWNLLGFGPDIRYGLAGGDAFVMENVYSSWHRYENGTPVPIDDWKSEVKIAHDSLMNSPGHRKNILDPIHTHVGVGLAYEPSTGEFRVAQEFINRYIDFSPYPRETTPGEIVDVSGKILTPYTDVVINLFYETFPKEMSVDELNQTSTYESPSQLLRIIPESNDNENNFSASIELGNQPGIYHINVWLINDSQEPHSGDLIIWVKDKDNQGEKKAEENAQNDLQSIKIGNPAPDFDSILLSGNPISLSDYKGSPVLLFFFATWCPYCQAEASHLQLVHEKYQDTGLILLAVNSGQGDDEKSAQGFAYQYGWNFPVIFDSTGEIYHLYEGKGIPFHIFIDKNGILSTVIPGSMDMQYLDQVVQGLISN